MSCITRCILRWGLISGLALGGVTLLVGPERVAMGFGHVRAKAQDVVDTCIDDPMAMRRQLRELADEYPERISEVRGEVAEVEQQISQHERDMQVAERVIAMASDDLDQLKELVAKAEAEEAAGTRLVSIRMDGVRFDIDEAYAEGRRIQNVREQYRDRLSADQTQLKFLGEQHARLVDILSKLEDEYATYESKLWQLDRQIDSIQRNERLIELTERQQATLDSYNRFDTPNLGQLEAKLAELRAEQEAQLQVLSKRGLDRDYENRAKFAMSDDGYDSNPFDDVILELKSDRTLTEPVVIE